MRAVSTAFRTHMVGIHFLAFIALGAAAAFFAFIALGMVTGNWANSEVTCVSFTTSFEPTACCSSSNIVNCA